MHGALQVVADHVARHRGSSTRTGEGCGAAYRDVPRRPERETGRARAPRPSGCDGATPTIVGHPTRRTDRRADRCDAHSSPGSPGRTARTWPSSCSARATRSTGSSAGRRASTAHHIDHLHEHPDTAERLHLHYGDLADAVGLTNLVRSIAPHEVYNLAAQSHVAVSFEIPDYTGDVTGLGAIRLLEALRAAGIDARYYQASSSEMFGNDAAAAGRGHAASTPAAPTRAAKVYAHHCHGELPRGLRDVHVQRHPLQPREPAPRRELRDPQDHPGRRPHQGRACSPSSCLGNLDARRDWGYAPEYVEAHVAHAPARRPGRLRGRHRRLATRCATSASSRSRHAGLDWSDHVKTNARYERPSEVPDLIGDPSKAARVLGWEPSVRTPDAGGDHGRRRRAAGRRGAARPGLRPGLTAPARRSAASHAPRPRRRGRRSPGGRRPAGRGRGLAGARPRVPRG